MWTGAYRRIERKREDERYQEEARVLYMYEQRANQKYEDKLLQKVFTAFKKNTHLEKDLKIVEVEHE